MSLTEDVVSVERYIHASPATVFAYFSSAERWMRWQGTDATIEPWPGGAFRMNVSGDGFASGRFLEVVPDRRLVFTWGWENGQPPIPPGSSTVEIDLLPQNGGTLVRLTHSGLPPEFVGMHQQGWEMYIGKLHDLISHDLIRKESGQSPAEE